MKRLMVLAAALFCARFAMGQVTQIDDDFESADPCQSGDWLCQGTTKWVDPAAPACADPNLSYGCNLYDPGEGYVQLTDGELNQGGNMFRSEKLFYDAFRLTAEVETRDGTIGQPADGMTIVIVGGDTPPAIGVGGGGMGAVFPGANPEIVFAFDNWSCNAGDQGDDNHVGFVYTPSGFTQTDKVPYQVLKHVA